MSIRTQRNSKRGVAAVVTAALGVSLLALTSPAGATATVTSVRISGADRYLTSVDSSTKAAAGGAFGANSTQFVLVNGNSPADALSAAAVAGSVNGTIISLPPSGALSNETKARIAAATNFIILGGPSALPATLEASLAAVAPFAAIERIQGTDRYQTAGNAALKATGKLGLVGGKRTAIVVSGESFADGVAAGPAAYGGPFSQSAVHPILLTAKDSLPTATSTRLVGLGVQQVILLGGTAVVSDAVKSSIEALGISVIRIAGADRYETAAKFADVAVTSEASGGLGYLKSAVGLANLTDASGFADALASSPYLGQPGVALLGVGSTVPASTTAWLTANKSTLETLHIFGGTSAVSADVVTAALNSAGKLAAPTASIVAREGSNIALVLFSEAVSVGGTYNLIQPNGTSGGAGTVTLAADKKSATVQFGSAFAVGATVRLVAGSATTADSRSIAQTDAVVVADTTAPVATVTALVGVPGVGNATKFIVTFDELVATVAGGGLVPANFTVNGADLPASSISSVAYKIGTNTTSAAAFLTAEVTTTAAGSYSGLAAGQVLGIKANVVKDLSTAESKNAAATTVVAADAVRPTIVGSPSWKNVKTSAFWTSGTGNSVLTVTAKDAGFETNSYDIQILTGTPAAVSVGRFGTGTLTGSTGTVNFVSKTFDNYTINLVTTGTTAVPTVAVVGTTITLTGTAATTAANVAAALASSTLVTATAGTSGVMGAATVTLAGGNANAIIVTTPAYNSTTGVGSAKALADAINASPAASALVTATFGGNGSGDQSAPLSPTFFSGGTETLRITFVFSETLGAEPTWANLTYKANGVATTFTGANTSNWADSDKKTVTIGYVLNNAGNRPVSNAATVEFLPGSFFDLAANPNLVVNPVVIVAG